MPITDYASRSTLSNIFKFYYLPRIRKQYYNATPVASLIKKRVRPEDFNGKKAIIAAHIGWSEAVGAGDEGDRLPEPYRNEVRQMEVDVARNRGRVRIDRLAIAASRNDAGAWERALRFEMDAIRENVIWDVARQMVFGDGTGKLAQVNGAVLSGATTITVDNPGTRMLRPNMSIAFFNGSTEEDAATTHRIASITSSTQFTLTTALGANVSDNDWIYRKPVPGASGVSTKDKEMMGLAGIIDDGTRVATFQNLSRSSNPWLKCNVLHNSGTLRSLTLSLLDAAAEAGDDGSGTQGADGGWDAIFSKHAIRRKYIDLVRTQQRYVNTLKIEGGWTAVEYMGKPWIADRMCRDNEVWFACLADMGYWVLSPLEWVDDDGAVLSRRADYDELEAYLVEYAQIGAHRCNRMTALKDISES